MLCYLSGSPSPRWFHGKITRDQAELLLSPHETGLYLVRESTNFPGDYTLCVSCDGKVEHYRIVYSNGKLTIDDEGFFENLMQLVEARHFFESSILVYCLLYFPVLQPVSVRPRGPHTVPGTNNEQEVSKRKSEQCAVVQSTDLKKTPLIVFAITMLVLTRSI